MGKPTKDQLDVALAQAVRMREAGEDDFYLARSLLNHQHRLQLLEEIYQAAALYMHGESPQRHAQLAKAIDAYRRYADSPG